MKSLLFSSKLLVGFVLLTLIHNSDGMFECILTQLDLDIKDSPHSNFNNLKIVRFNRTTFVLNGTFELFVDSIDDFKSLCSIYKKGGNEYKLTAYKFGPLNVCDALIKDDFFYPAIHATTENFPKLRTCDFKKGVIYKIINYLPNLSQVPPVFQSGDYMIECKTFKGDEYTQGIKIYAQVYNIAGGMY